MENICSLEEAQKISNKIVQWRRDLHKIPEIGMELPKTEAYLKKILEQLDIKYKSYSGHSGLTVDFGNGKGKTVVIRADMDALPIVEETGLPYASDNQNMHACGHDAHMAMLLGTATVLKMHEQEINGTVRLLFQPGEEFPGGAQVMVQDGVLENPHADYVLALHVSNRDDSYKNGDVAVNWEHTTAADDQLYLTIYGKGGHGSRPDQCVDPVAIAALVVNNLQYIISREVSPYSSSVLTIATMRGGNGVNNIIPDTAEIIGTVRNLDKETRDFVLKRIEEIVEHTVKAMRGDYVLEFKYPYPAIKNNKVVVKEFVDAAEKILGKDRCHILQFPELGGEDAGYYFEKIPGCYFYLQCPQACPLDGKTYGAHNSKFCLDDSVLYVGTAMFLETTKKLLSF